MSEQPMTGSKKAAFVGLALVAAGAIAFTALRTPAVAATVNLTEKIPPAAVDAIAPDEDFYNATADFSWKLAAGSYGSESNFLLSPPSVYFALGMTGGGAGGDTLQQFLTLLGGESSEALSAHYRHLQNSMEQQGEQATVDINQSVWFKEGFAVEDDFLQQAAHFYDAEAFSSAFDEKTIAEINAWVSEKTQGMIPEIIKELTPMSRMMLLNTVLFDARWQSPYLEHQQSKGSFTRPDGTVVTADYLQSQESRYLENDLATGFLKPYAGGDYSFMALLPKEGATPTQLLSNLQGSDIRALVKNPAREGVLTQTPTFSFGNEFVLNTLLSQMGLNNAFISNLADFSGITKTEPLYIDQVLHSSFVELSPEGTKAGAATSIGIATSSAPIPPSKTVTLDRAFVFAIVHNETGLPLFVGVVEDPTAH